MPAPAWFPLSSKRYGLSRNLVLSGLYSALNILFSGGPRISLFFLGGSPKKRFASTVTRGPMVRKKQSREQISSATTTGSLLISIFCNLKVDWYFSSRVLGYLFCCYNFAFRDFLANFDFLLFQQKVLVKELPVFWVFTLS